MSVYVDDASIPYGRMLMSHLVADSLEELHAMADRIGVARRWFQRDASTPHYDVCRAKRALALRYGAVALDRRAMAAWLRKWRDQAECKDQYPSPTPQIPIEEGCIHAIDV